MSHCQYMWYHNTGDINHILVYFILTLCRRKDHVGIGYQPHPNPLHKEPGKPLATWSICCTCDYISFNCCHWLYKVSCCGNGGGGVRCSRWWWWWRRWWWWQQLRCWHSLGELNESVFSFLLSLLYLPFYIKSYVAAVMAKFKVLFQHLSWETEDES